MTTATTTTSWRAHYAAGLYALDVPIKRIQEALGQYTPQRQPVTRQRVYQLLRKAGVDIRRPPTPAAIDAAILDARRQGLTERQAIISAACTLLRPEHGKVSRTLVTSQLAQRWGKRRFIPPMGKDDWLWCSGHRDFVPPGQWRANVCRSCANARMRVVTDRQRRRKGIPTREATLAAKRLAAKQRRQQIAVYVAAHGVERATAHFQLTASTIYQLVAQARREVQQVAA